MWCLQTEKGDATALRVFDDEMILVNMSVWESLGALRKICLSRQSREGAQAAGRLVRAHGAGLARDVVVDFPRFDGQRQASK